MICRVSDEDVKDSIEIHWNLQLGSYFLSVHNLGGAVYNLGGRVTDYYWNYAGLINTVVGQEQNLINTIVEFAKEHDRTPAVYIDPTIHPPSFIKALRDNGFQSEDEEIWMFFNPNINVDIPHIPNLRISKVRNNRDMDVFVRIFNEAFELITEDQDNSDYGLSLLDAFMNKELKVDIVHFIGWVDDNPVSVASTYIYKDVAGIYNVGTPESYRCNGYGGALSLAAINEARKRKCRRLLLQTELNSGPERLYSKLGFEQAFSAGIWSKSN